MNVSLHSPLLSKLIIICWLFFFGSMTAQEDAWLYMRAKDTLFNPTFSSNGDVLKYTGNDARLRNVLSKYQITSFKKTFRRARKENLKKTFFIIANSEGVMKDLLTNASHLFEYGEVIASEDKKIFEPNDYGLTSTIGDSKGFQANLDYYDFLEVPKAWYYTTGSPKTIIGISDGMVDSLSPDFKHKLKVFKKSSFSNGHGSGVASIAAGQGDDAFGVPGLCYDCDIYATNYGGFRNLAQLMELSKAGARVINCSWVGRGKYETAQAAIDEMFENGTIIVAGSGNKGYKATNGTLLYYPASYDKVISVSSGMYKYETPQDNLKISQKGNYYGENIRGYLSRTVGFRKNDPTTTPYNYSESTGTLNKEVDMLAPTVGVFRYSKYVQDGRKDEYLTYQATSTSTPFITGTIGLMVSLNPCLPTKSIEPILKMTSYNVDGVGDNYAKYKDLYGAGIVNTGRAVEMVYKLYTPSEEVVIENQHFTRWKFPFEALSERVVFQNMSFTENAQLTLTARNQIVLKPGTRLQANSEGKTHLKIDQSLLKKCDLELRDPSIVDK